MNIANKYFLENIEDIARRGSYKPARAKYQDGTQAYKYSIDQVFEKYPKGELPIHTLRDTAVKTGIQEMLWIYKDQSNKLEDAHKRGINWWDSFNVGDNTIGNAYGKVIKDYGLLDNLLFKMINNPFGQRHILSMWQDDAIDEQSSLLGLPPCAFLTQYTIHEIDGKRQVNMHLQIRSSDYITAGAINRIQYYALGLMICGHLTFETGIIHELGIFSVFTMDMHIYDRHMFAVDELQSQMAVNDKYELKLNGIKNFYDYDIEDFEIKRPKGIYKLSKQLELAV